MGRVSELIGEVVDGTLVENRKIDGETFYTIQVSFRGTVIPVLFSSFINDTVYPVDTKLKISGCIMSDIKEDTLPVFYFYANSIEVVDIDEESTNIINFTCTVTKVREFKTNGRCIDILPLVGADGSPLNSTSVLYLCARAQVARKLKDKPKGYTLTGTGYLKAYKDIYEIYIVDVENLDEILAYN